jgi:hypothetical protein
LPRTGQLNESQLPCGQVRSHWQAAEHATAPQEPAALQAIVQRDPELQEMASHAPAALQLIVQVQPDGHVICESQSAEPVQSTWQVRAFSSHDVQSDGQFGTTQ